MRYDQWERIVDAAREHSGDGLLPLWSALVNYYSVCIPSLITDLSARLWSLHQRIDGTRNETYTSFYNLPAFWVSACDVIDAEIARIDKVRADKAARQQQQLLRNMRTNNGVK